MIIVDSLEKTKLRLRFSMPLSIQSLRNESDEFPNMPRQLTQRLVNDDNNNNNSFFQTSYVISR